MKMHMELEISPEYFQDFHGEGVSPSQKGVRRVRCICN